MLFLLFLIPLSVLHALFLYKESLRLNQEDFFYRKEKNVHMVYLLLSYQTDKF